MPQEEDKETLGGVLGDAGKELLFIAPTAAVAGGVAVGAAVTSVSGFVVVGGAVFAAAMVGLSIGMVANHLTDRFNTPEAGTPKYWRNKVLKESVMYQTVEWGDRIFSIWELKDVRKNVKALAEFRKHYAANKSIVNVTRNKDVVDLKTREYNRLVKMFTQTTDVRFSQMNQKKVKYLVQQKREDLFDGVGLVTDTFSWANDLSEQETYEDWARLLVGVKGLQERMRPNIDQWLKMNMPKACTVSPSYGPWRPEELPRQAPLLLH